MALLRRSEADEAFVEELAGEQSPQQASGASPWRVWLLRTLAQIGMVAVLIPLAGLGAGLGGLAAWLEEAPRLEEFEAYKPPQTTTILDRRGESLASLFEQRRIVVRQDQIPRLLPLGFVAIEDERFFEHLGVDPYGVARAFAINLWRGRFSQGASTITQQTARNLVPEIGREKTARRKVLEALAALQMEHHYTKEQILTVYLNHIYLGSGAYGVQAAAMTYFGKPAARLSIAESATLAGLPQLPERYSPLNNPDLATRRRDQVLLKLLEHNYITEGEYADAVTTPMTTSSDRQTTSTAAYFVDAVRRQLSEHEELGGTELQAAGWMIRTTVDPQMQRTAERLLREGLAEEEEFWLAGRQERYAEAFASEDHARAPAPGQVRMGRVVRGFKSSLVVELPGGWRADLPIPTATRAWFALGSTLHPDEGVDVEVIEVDAARGLWRGRLLPQQRLQGAIVCLDAATGDVRALVGGRAWNDPTNNGFYNRAVLARRQAGSTLKPLFFAAGLERGLAPTSILDDTRTTFGDGYTPRNYDEKFLGRVTLQRSLEQSRNIPTIRVVQSVGLRRAVEFVARFQRTGERPWQLPLEWPVVLGTTSVTPLELAAAYQPLANAGVARGPRLIEGVWNEDDRETVGVPVPEPATLLGAREAALLTQMMAGVLTHGTGEKLLPLLPPDLHSRVAGKSGTTNDNRDAWFAGFTPHEVVVVWLGFDQNIPLAPGRTGSKAAGPIWARTVAALWNLKTPEERQDGLRMPEGWRLVAVDPATGAELPSPSAGPQPPTLRALQGTTPPAVAEPGEDLAVVVEQE